MRYVSGFLVGNPIGDVSSKDTVRSYFSNQAVIRLCSVQGSKKKIQIHILYMKKLENSEAKAWGEWTQDVRVEHREHKAESKHNNSGMLMVTVNEVCADISSLFCIPKCHKWVGSFGVCTCVPYKADGRPSNWALSSSGFSDCSCWCPVILCRPGSSVLIRANICQPETIQHRLTEHACPLLQTGSHNLVKTPTGPWLLYASVWEMNKATENLHMALDSFDIFFSQRSEGMKTIS